MTNIDAMKLFREKCDELGQSKVAADLKRSPSAINQLYHGKYQGAPDVILGLVIEVYGGLSVDCPIKGEISLALCARERRKPYEAVTNPEAARLYRACRKCTQNTGINSHNNGGKP